MPTRNIEDVKKKGMAEWERKLETIKIETASDDRKKVFYTAMFYTMVQPRDRTGDNPKWKSTQPYWDDNFATRETCRSAFPLVIIIDPNWFGIICFVL